MNTTNLMLAGAAAIFASAAGSAIAADAAKINWSAAPKSEITLFYPGQASYQYLLSEAHGKGAKGVREGRSCVRCHEGEEASIGNTIVSGKRLEPNPIVGLRGTIPLTVQAAYDSENLYLRFSWPAKEAGAFHEYVVYQDGKWTEYGGHRAKAAVASGKMRASYEDRLAIMLGDGKGVPAFRNQGCFITCHNDMRFMPNEAKSDAVAAHPYLGKSGLRRTDIRKYLAESRTAMGPTGGWDKVKPKEELEALRAKGAFLDLWQWRAFRSNPVGAADDGYVFEYRLFDAGRNPFFGNWDGAKSQPRFMFDPAKNEGRAGLAAAQFRDPKAPTLNDKNRVPYDPNFKWRNGDLLPAHGNEVPDGSAGDNRPVVGTWANGTWTVLWTRKLNTGNKDDIVLRPGESYPVGFSVHDDNVTARFHHVSFPLMLSVGGKYGDIQAARVK
ncbi:MAG: hypothetical protein FJ027_21915 [Candidatus Rokubacteria bacterium]|nr:hypothetical protein [Candidatus Rokubacteria bacterium]